MQRHLCRRINGGQWHALSKATTWVPSTTWTWLCGCSLAARRWLQNAPRQSTGDLLKLSKTVRTFRRVIRTSVLTSGASLYVQPVCAFLCRYHADTGTPRPTHMRDVAARSEGVIAATSAAMPLASTAAAAASPQPAQPSAVPAPLASAAAAAAAAAAAPAMISSPRHSKAPTAGQKSSGQPSSPAAVVPLPPPASPVQNQPSQPSAVSALQQSAPPVQPRSQATQDSSATSVGVLPPTKASAVAVGTAETAAPSATSTPLLPPAAAAASPPALPAQQSLVQPNGHAAENGTAPSKSPGAGAPSGLPVRPGSGGSVPVKLTRPATGGSRHLYDLSCRQAHCLTTPFSKVDCDARHFLVWVGTPWHSSQSASLTHC